MASELTKEELRAPDFFLAHTQTIVEGIYRVRFVILGLLVISMVFGLGWIGVNYLQNLREQTATTDLYEIEKKMKTSLEKTKQMSDADLAEFEKTLIKHASTKSAYVSFVAITPSMLKVGKAAMALDWAKKMKKPEADNIHFALFRMALGTLSLEAQQFDQAIQNFQEILSSSNWKSFHPEALLKTGIAYQMKNELDKAKSTFETVLKDHPNTQASEMALEYLLYIESHKGA